MMCNRYPTKRTFRTRAHALAGAEAIRTAKGETYVPLYPFLCTDDSAHWHLTHYPQGRKPCPECLQIVPAWNGGKHWVIGVHSADDPDTGCVAQCIGEGALVP